MSFESLVNDDRLKLRLVLGYGTTWGRSVATHRYSTTCYAHRQCIYTSKLLSSYGFIAEIH